MAIKGLANMKQAMEKSAEFLKLKNNEAKVIRVLVPADEIIGTYEHTEQFGGFWKTVPCLGKNECPLCAAGKRASFRAYIPVLDTSDNKVKIFKANKDTVKFIIGLVEEYGDLTARDFKLVRSGDGLNTTYQLFAKDPAPRDLSDIELPDIESMVTPMSKEALLDLMNGGGVSSGVYSDDSDDLPF